VRVITIGAEDDPASAPLVKYAKDIANELRGQMVRVDTDFGSNPINSDKSRAGAKIQDAEQLRVHPADAGLGIGDLVGSSYQI
jgi:threonyl-tRNA synthetase